MANDVFLCYVPTDTNPNDVRLRDPLSPCGGGPVFPTQYFGLRIRKSGLTLDLCLVALADAPSGMGGQLRVRASGVTRAVYLVEVGDPNASPLRIRTTTGTKAIRLKT